MSEQKRMAEKAAALARRPVWHTAPHEHLLPKKFALQTKARFVSVYD